MMSTLNALKLSTAKKSLNTTPVVHRRNKLGKKLWEQIQLAQAHLAGKQFTTTRFQTVRDDVMECVAAWKYPRESALGGGTAKAARSR